MCHPHRMGGKGKDRKKKSTQPARQAAQRRAVQQRTAERRVRELRFPLLSPRGAPLAVGVLRAFAVAGPDSAVRDHARTLANAAGRTAPAWAAELGQAIPGKCWVTTDPFRECTVLLCEFSYPNRGNRHAVIARLDPVWHDAVSSLAAPFLEEEGSLDAGSALGLARRLGADLREGPSAEAAGLLRAGL